MDGEVSTSQTDQISLYGLFGDSSATLQGLNDHLSPSLLQQSPPCGSVISTQAPITKVVTSPNKVIFNGVQQGVLLSDLADRSPSAGSVTVASLCSYVSFDNLRCTNLVTRKGNRFCSQHSKEVITERPAPSSNLKKTVSFTPLTQLKPGGSISVNTGPPPTVGTVKAVKLGLKSLSSGGLKSKSAIMPDATNAASKGQQNQMCLVRKVGQQITVTARSVGQRNTETHAMSIQTAPISSSPVRTVTTAVGTSKPKSHPKSGEFAISSAKVTPRATQTSVPNNKPNGMDEDVLKKVVGVLNSRNDLTSQQQISLLQSMGITVVQGPPAIAKNLTVRKKKPSKPVVRRVITIGNAKNLPTAVSSFKALPVLNPGIDQAHSTSLNGSQNSSALSPIRPLPSAMETISRQASGLQLPISKSKVESSLPINGKSLTAMESLARQAARSPQVSDPSKKELQGNGKVAQKRKEKPVGSSSGKKSKPAQGKSTATEADVQAPSVAKKSKMSKPSVDNKLKQQKKAMRGKPLSRSFFTVRPPPKMLQAPARCANCVRRLAQHLNEKTLMDYSLFGSESIETGEKVEGDKNKTLKSKLLKRHLARKRIQSTGALDYKQCLKDLNGTDFCRTFSAANTLLHLLRRQNEGGKTIVHHEKILQAVVKDGDYEYRESLEDDGPSLDSYPFNDDQDLDEVAAFTLQTVYLKNKYNRLVRQLDAEEKELKMLLECYHNDPKSTIKLLNSMSESTHNTSQVVSSLEPRKCHISSDHGLSCKAAALPYASYCKQHIWYCQSQCLYKLDQNMKPIADISPEPLVKKVRKKTKLLPLIKRYKKKKKRKIEGNDGSNPDLVSLKSHAAAARLQTAGNSLQSNTHMQSQSSRGTLLGEITKSVKIDDSDLEETKPSDSDEEDLNLTTNEIMLSGVLDKLPDDPDFDLFTTDKGAEELERALLLASASPDQMENDMDTQEYHSCDSLLSNAKLNGSPSAIVNCDAPKSNEQPPSLESFNKSQCVHYTFGSNLPGISVDKTENEACELDDGDEVAPPLISAEDLKDIEGVLERLDAEDVNSPKLPSSPAVDQYTSMLARQLSQEVETESLKQLSSSNDLANLHNTFSSLKEQVTLSRTYSLPTSSIHNVYSARKSDIVTGQVSIGNELQQCGVVHNVTTICSSNETSISTPGVKNSAQLQKSVSADPQPTLLAQRPVQKLPTTLVVNNARSESTADLPSMQGTAKSVKEVSAASTVKFSNQASIPVSPRTPQQKSSQSPTVVSSPVLPVTLMQSPSQSGNVIKVIVPPGTMVNGTNGQQNMLLIPVSALMKQNALQASQSISSGLISGVSNQTTPPNVRTQLSNLQTGQQFFIVNNHAGSAQTHLALVQKPVIGASQQAGVFVKPSQKSVALQKDEISKQSFGNRIQGNTKLNLNDRLKQNQAAKQPASTDIGNTSGSKSSDMKSGASGGTLSIGISQPRSTVAGQIMGRQDNQQGNARRIKNPGKKVKAKFDPVTKRYVPSTSIAASASVVPGAATTSFTTSTDPNLTERRKKFNASALSIQSKVQQIDSVLSSLNAAKNSQPVIKQPTNLSTDKKVKSSRSTTANMDKVPASNHSPYIPVQTPVAVMSSPLPQSSSTPVLPKTTVNSSLKEKLPKRQKTAIGKQNKPAPKKSISATANASPPNKAEPSSSASVPVSSGTVHWNQTTTAGPEVTTTTLTVPVYITGAIPAGTWPGDLTLKGSLTGASLPVILPAHKISPHCQVPQRVLLGSIGSLAVRSQVVTVASSASNIKPTRTIITPVTLPVNGGAGCSAVLQKQATSSTGMHIQQSCIPVVKNAEGPMPSQTEANLQTSKTAEPGQEDMATKRKPGRKTNHSNILHDPLMYDPTASDGSLSNAS